MSFEVDADAYTRFMGRFSEPLAVRFCDQAGVRPGQRVLDVGCGPGALTAELVGRLGADAVASVDPSPPFVAAVRDRFPSVDVRLGVAEALPFPDERFDRTLTQLVVHFMRDPVAGLAEMRRATAAGGRVAACVWDLAGGRAPLSTFWRAVRDVDPGAQGESGLAGARAGHLAALAEEAGLHGVVSTTLTVAVRFARFDDWWAPYTLGVGPAGDYVAKAPPERADAVRRRCRELLPEAPFEVTGTAWCVVGTR